MHRPTFFAFYGSQCELRHLGYRILFVRYSTSKPKGNAFLASAQVAGGRNSCFLFVEEIHAAFADAAQHRHKSAAECKAERADQSNLCSQRS